MPMFEFLVIWICVQSSRLCTAFGCMAEEEKAWPEYLGASAIALFYFSGERGKGGFFMVIVVENWVAWGKGGGIYYRS